MPKKRLSRKELKRQQKAQKEQIRHQRGWELNNEPQHDPLAMLIPVMGNSEEETIANMMDVVLASEFLADEEEFAEMLFSPLESADIFVEVAREMGWPLEKLDELEDEELDDLHFDIIQNCIPEIVTPDRKQEILQALKDCQKRLQRQGDPNVSQVSLVYFLLSGKEMGEGSWQLTSLVHRLVHRSVATGFVLAESSSLAEVDSLPIEQMLDITPQSGITKKIEGLLKRIPGLRGYLEKQADEVWEEGEQAVFEAKLNLGLFAEEELEVVAHLIAQFLEPAFKGGVDGSTEEAMPQFVAELGAYLDQLFAEPDRIEQVRTRIINVLREEAVEPQWMPFVFLIKGHMDEEDAAEYQRPFFAKAALGETFVRIKLARDDAPIVHE